MFQRVDFLNEMLAKLDECDAWLVGKDEAMAKLAEAEAKYNEAKEAVADYTEENVAQVEAYRDDLRARLVALGVVEDVKPVEVVEEEPIVEEAVAPVEEAPVEDGMQKFIDTIVTPNM